MLTSRRALQVAVAVLSLIPIGGGLGNVIGGLSLLGGSGPVDLDSHYHYLSGLLLGIGLAFWSTVPGIERKGERFRVLSFVVVVGGLSRLAALLTAGTPSPVMLAALAMETVVTPLLCLWQFQVERQSRLTPLNL